MTLKGLATQLECRGVDPGYVQRFNWEDWILNRCEDMGTKSLVLYLLQEYLGVEEQERVAELKNELSSTKEDLRETMDERDQARIEGENVEEDLAVANRKIVELKLILTKAGHEVELLLEREKTLRGAIHKRDDRI